MSDLAAVYAEFWRTRRLAVDRKARTARIVEAYAHILYPHPLMRRYVSR